MKSKSYLKQKRNRQYEEITKEFSEAGLNLSEIKIEDFAESRKKETIKFQKVLSSKKTSKTGHQLLPKHMRRRQMSHNPYRIPRRNRLANLTVNVKSKCRKHKRKLNNDQQRNYIEILKQTIESSLVKTGLKPMIENSATQSGKDFYNTVIEISSLHNEMEKIKSDNTALEVINAKLKNEVDYLNKSNTNFKEKIQDSLESGIKELEEAKGKIRILENEKENLLTQLNEANEYNERLKQAIQKYSSAAS